MVCFIGMHSWKKPTADSEYQSSMKQRNCVMFCRKRALRLTTDFSGPCQVQHPASNRTNCCKTARIPFIC